MTGAVLAAYRRISTALGLTLVLLVTTMATAADAQNDPRVSELSGQLDQESATLRDVAAQANAALDASQQATFAQERADEVARSAALKLAAARKVVEDRKAEISDFAAAAYRSGGSPQLRQMSLMFSSNSDTALLKSDTLNYVSGKQRETLQRAAIERRQEQLALDAADVANEAAGKSAGAAADARRKADALVVRQRSVVDGVSNELTSAVTVAGVEAERRARAERLAQAERIAERLAEAERFAEFQRLAEAQRVASARRARARQRAARARRASQQRAAAAQADAAENDEEVATDPPPASSGCAGGSLKGYRNGRLPTSALCALWGAPSHRLRADAAAAFGQLSRAYAGEFGRPMCVTDSYRTYYDQVDVKRRKPGLAATPGTSQHGWGLAVDLCDGVENAGSAANSWLHNNAGRFRFFHPRWADSGGGGPYEPWHWEFAG
ncbi:MAG: M15 family metallopeptidase [Mycobacteriales bacterium]